jgi:SHS2 domain-containing protein
MHGDTSAAGCGFDPAAPGSRSGTAKSGVGVAISAGSGRRTVPHTADLRIEAWAPTREECVAQAVLAMVESFADIATPGEVSATRRTDVVELPVAAGTDEDMLAGALDEVIFLLDTAGQVPVEAAVQPDDGGLRVRLAMTDAERVELIGAVPKAVSLSDLRFGRSAGGWSCEVTVDV